MYQENDFETKNNLMIHDEFVRIYKDNIKREGADKLLDYLERSDFFKAPASSKYHSSYQGGLADHSINVYRRLLSLVRAEEDLKDSVSDESIAIIGLLHDLCKIDFYKIDYKNQKINGVWESVPFYRIEEALPFGHGEKSVYIVNKYMKLSDLEALSINWHMGPYDNRLKGSGPQSLEQAYQVAGGKLIFLAHIADSMATYLDEA